MSLFHPNHNLQQLERFSQILWIHFTYTSAKVPMENIWKWEAHSKEKLGKRLDEPFGTFKADKSGCFEVFLMAIKQVGNLGCKGRH